MLNLLSSLLRLPFSEVEMIWFWKKLERLSLISLNCRVLPLGLRVSHFIWDLVFQWQYSKFGRYLLALLLQFSFLKTQRHSGWPCFPWVLCDSLTSAQIYSAPTHDTVQQEKEGKTAELMSRTCPLSSRLIGICNRCSVQPELERASSSIFKMWGSNSFTTIRYRNCENYILMTTRYGQQKYTIY